MKFCFFPDFPTCRAEDCDYSLFRNRKWEEDPTALDEREKHVLRLSIQELTQKKIADKLCLSVDTIKKIKQKFFDKLGVHTLTETIHAAEKRAALHIHNQFRPQKKPAVTLPVSPAAFADLLQGFFLFPPHRSGRTGRLRSLFFGCRTKSERQA